MKWISAAIALASLFVCPAVANGYVYWTNAYGALGSLPLRNGYEPEDFAGTIGRANLDGSGTDEQYIDLSSTPPTSITGIDVDDDFIYWTTGVSGATIGRARLDGGEVEPNLVTGLNFPIHLVTDGDHIYWVNYGTGSIGRAALDGSGVDKEFIEGAEIPIGVAVDGDHIYWTDIRRDQTGTSFYGVIGRANLDGSHVDHEFLPVAGDPVSVALGGDGQLYWAQRSSGVDNRTSIGRSDLEGRNVDNDFLTGFSQAGVEDMAVDANHIYWAPNYGPIGRAALDGTGFDPDFIDQTNGPRGIAVDEGDPHPVIGGLRVTPNRFSVQHGSKRASAGSAIELDLSEDATVTFRVRRESAVQRGAAPPKYPRMFRRELSAGGNSLPFDGRIGRLRLSPRSYNLTAIARDGDNLRSDLVEARFRVVR